MKIKTYLITLVLLCTAFACSEDSVEVIMTTVSFHATLPEEIHNYKVNAELKCININTGEKLFKGGIKNLSFMQKMQKGYYIIHLNGVIVYKDTASGKMTSKRIRGYIDDAVFLNDSSKYTIPLMFI